MIASRRLRLCVSVGCLLVPEILPVPQATAHEIRPAYLEINRIGPNRYDVLWRTPVFSGKRLPVVLRLPDSVTNVTAPVERPISDSVIERRLIEAPGGLAGKRLAFVGLQATITDVLVRIELENGTHTAMIVRPSRPFVDVPEEQGMLAIAVTYLRQGVEHILFGFDHLLFVAALMLIVRDRWMLVKTVTAFTVAHSITLSLATFGLLTPAAAPVEAMIAASIVLAASEAVRRERGRSSLTTEWPWIVAFFFGLLHGFGFAGALRELGLPQGDVPLALFSFNVGVEMGQLVFIGILLLIVHALRQSVTLPRSAPLAAAYVIGAVAVYWCVERIGELTALGS